MNNIKLIMVSIEDYNSWKRGDLLLNMKNCELVDIVKGVKIREKLVKQMQQQDPLWYPKSFEELTKSEKCRSALTYEEFKELTEHIDKKIVKDVVSILIKIV